jgi:D-glycero-D-manno-heptose 1,7-bisphosphate phosphatase
MSSPPETVFLDRDGTINVKAPEGDYVKSWAEFEFLPGAREAIRRLAESGARIIVVTNQRGVALGRMTREDVEDIHARLLKETGDAIAAIYFCPHDHDACECRKPGTGMFRQARAAFGDIEFERTTVIGDARSDIEAARAIGARPILIGDGADYDVEIASSLADAVERVLATAASATSRKRHQ